MKISREVKTALLVIAGIALFIFGYNYLKGKNLLNSDRTYFAIYDNVEGLSPSTPVTINGLNVGTVQKIDFSDDSGKLLVTMNITKDFTFSKNSEAQLYEAGLIGGKSIAIVPKFDNSGVAESGAYLKGTVKGGLTDLVNEKLNPLQEKMEIMLVSADSVLTNINDIFDANTKANLKSSVSKLNSTIGSFNSMADSMNSLITDNKEKLDNTLTNVDKVSSDLSNLSGSLVEADLKKTITELQATVNNFNEVLSSIESGEGSMGKLLKDEKLYNNLEGASKQLEQLLEDMKLNPKRYVHFSLFGKKPKQYDAEGNEIKSKD
ncbi:MAG: MCE family protein [Bacteroidia bacterium]|nr:MCE family protein [Bacteroidia bacterium]MBT8310664.1 MCE family protein [Bacteroidia bacterium]NND11219.1 MCE family protein [Flavobacteriaceae bacterium]NNL60282.1 MCE family protein [Flavobacteriaceae bacterium]RZV60521.1 MAG: MCE family protein [Flavobacteriaceae bacterium]